MTIAYEYKYVTTTVSTSVLFELAEHVPDEFIENTSSKIDSSVVVTVPTTIINDEKPLDKTSSLDKLVTEQSVVTPTTMMSLADRLKLRLSNSASVIPTPNQAKAISSNPSFMTEATFPSKKTTFETKFLPSNPHISTETPLTEEPRNNLRFEENLSIDRNTARPIVGNNFQSHAAANNDESAGHVLSLAERLAQRKSKLASKPSFTDRRTSSLAPFTDETFTEESTTRRINTLSKRLKFRNSRRPSVSKENQPTDESRRIPVRTIDELPRIRVLSDRSSSLQPATRTTTESPSITETQPTPTITRSTPRRLVSIRALRPTTEASTSTTTISTPIQDTILTSCPELQCLDGKCIAIVQLNDGVVDCSDGSDEQDFGGLIT